MVARATNSEFYIGRNFDGFTFITGLPLFIAMMMCDPVVRDFRIGVDPLIFSKPVLRLGYAYLASSSLPARVARASS